MLYHKIEGPFKRDEKDIKKVDRTQWRNPTVQMLADARIWIATEKLDGTNIRIEWDGHRVTFGGRTERAEIPGGLRIKLEEQWLGPGVEEKFEEMFGEKPVTIVGEGLGPKIQGGGKYGAEPQFVAFDVAVDGKYLSDENARDVVSRFDCEFAPVEATGDLHSLIEKVSDGIDSWFGDFEPEGLVARPVLPLYDHQGNRVIVKLKAVDLKEA